MNSKRAFTLLEILVATVIMTALVGAMFSVFNGALRLREKTFKAVEEGLPRSYIRTLVKRDISCMAPPVGIMAGPVVGESGETGDIRKDTLEFITTTGIVNDNNPFGDLQKVEYYLLEPEEEEEREDYDLVRAVSRNLLASTEEDPEQQRLLKGVQSLEITYFQDDVWSDTWDSTTVENEVPEAVKFQIGFTPKQGLERDIPPLTIVCEVVSEKRPGEKSGNETSR